MAEKMFIEMVKLAQLEGIGADSAGTAAMPHYAIIGDLKVVMDENKIDYSGHRPRMISGGIIKNTDLVLTMTESQKEEIRYKFPEYRDKVLLLSEFAVGSIEDVEDPIGLGKEAYVRAYKQIDFYLEKIAEKFKDEFRK